MLGLSKSATPERLLLATLKASKCPLKQTKLMQDSIANLETFFPEKVPILPAATFFLLLTKATSDKSRSFSLVYVMLQSSAYSQICILDDSVIWRLLATFRTANSNFPH